eukprot:934198-Rhodomonas_salina.1
MEDNGFACLTHSAEAPGKWRGMLVRQLRQTIQAGLQAFYWQRRPPKPGEHGYQERKNAWAWEALLESITHNAQMTWFVLKHCARMAHRPIWVYSPGQTHPRVIGWENHTPMEAGETPVRLAWVNEALNGPLNTLRPLLRTHMITAARQGAEEIDKLPRKVMCKGPMRTQAAHEQRFGMHTHGWMSWKPRSGKLAFFRSLAAEWEDEEEEVARKLWVCVNDFIQSEPLPRRHLPRALSWEAYEERRADEEWLDELQIQATVTLMRCSISITFPYPDETRIYHPTHQPGDENTVRMAWVNGNKDGKLDTWLTMETRPEATFGYMGSWEFPIRSRGPYCTQKEHELIAVRWGGISEEDRIVGSHHLFRMMLDAIPEMAEVFHTAEALRKTVVEAMLSGESRVRRVPTWASMAGLTQDEYAEVLEDITFLDHGLVWQLGQTLQRQIIIWMPGEWKEMTVGPEGRGSIHVLWYNNKLDGQLNAWRGSKDGEGPRLRGDGDREVRRERDTRSDEKGESEGEGSQQDTTEARGVAGRNAPGPTGGTETHQQPHLIHGFALQDRYQP